MAARTTSRLIITSSYHFIVGARWRVFGHGDRIGNGMVVKMNAIDIDAAYPWLVFCAAKQPLRLRPEGFVRARSMKRYRAASQQPKMW
jgi:hypothetical protein